MSKLEQNTTSLDEVLAMVNALPDAGSGGGASTLDTGTLTGVTTLLDPPGGNRPYYYDLESIPNYSTKKMIVCMPSSETTTQELIALLTREDTDNAFEMVATAVYNTEFSASIEDTVLSMTLFIEFRYYAV